MKKIILTIAFIASGMVASAQVGIGNEDPKVSLQVDRSEVAADADGVLVPRVTVAQLNSKSGAYGEDQNGALVFVTAIAGAADETSNVTATGFHYYDFATDKWVGFGSKPAPARLSATGGALTNADLNGAVIYTGGTNGAEFTVNTILNPKQGDTVTISDNGTGTFTVSSNGLGSGTRTGPSANGGSVTYVYVGSAWYHTNSF